MHSQIKPPRDSLNREMVLTALLSGHTAGHAGLQLLSLKDSPDFNREKKQCVGQEEENDKGIVSKEGVPISSQDTFPIVTVLFSGSCSDKAPPHTSFYVNLGNRSKFTRKGNLF